MKQVRGMTSFLHVGAKRKADAFGTTSKPRVLLQEQDIHSEFRCRIAD
jgi:hypothetical protein